MEKTLILPGAAADTCKPTRGSRPKYSISRLYGLLPAHLDPKRKRSPRGYYATESRVQVWTRHRSYSSLSPNTRLCSNLTGDWSYSPPQCVPLPQALQMRVYEAIFLSLSLSLSLSPLSISLSLCTQIHRCMNMYVYIRARIYVYVYRTKDVDMNK